MERNYQPVADIIGRLEICTLPEGSMPLDGVFVIKALDKDGVAQWYTRCTKTTTQFETLAALSVAHKLHMDGIIETYVDIDDDEGDT
jgi:hypothetical protein